MVSSIWPKFRHFQATV